MIHDSMGRHHLCGTKKCVEVVAEFFKFYYKTRKKDGGYPIQIVCVSQQVADEGSLNARISERTNHIDNLLEIMRRASSSRSL